MLLGNAELENNATEVINNFGEKKILIYSHVDKKVSSFYKFVISPVALKKEHHPEVMLRGIDGHSFLGDSTVSLGWYEKKIDAEQELEEILKAISKGKPTYELKYDVKVKTRGIVDIEMAF